MADDLPLTIERRHDLLCDEFEARWRNGASPRIEEVLALVAPQERAALFEALLRVEIEMRPSGTVQAADYQARFPEFGEVVHALLRQTAVETENYAQPGSGAFVPPLLQGYEIVRLLGAGGMGVVYLARHHDLNQLVAVKVVRAGSGSRPEDLKRFRREARSVASLSHPHIVKIFGYGQVDSGPYFVMEFVESGSLAARLQGQPSEPVWAVGLVETLARTVQYVHEQTLVHRDLKPANILLTADGTPKIADFGLAKKFSSDDPQLTASQTVLGTACYMAPEQAEGRTKDVGPAADIYALGAILFELLTGQPPFRAETHALTIVQVITQDPPRLKDLVPGLAPELEAICMKCLDKEVSRRYTSANALAEDLGRFRDGLPVSALPLRDLDQDSRWVSKLGYEILAPMGRTRWSVAYSARQISIQRKVLLKRSTGKPGSAEHLAMHLQAAAMSALAEHPNVIRLYDYGEKFDQAYLIGEFIDDAVPLSRCLRDAAGPTDSSGSEHLGMHMRGVPFAPDRAAKVALRIGLGLQAVHEHGFLLCSLQSSDILLTRDDVPKIANFTAVRRIAGKSGPSPDWVSPNYLSPELVAEHGSVSPATDVYGLGAVLYDMLVGVPPFLAPDRLQTRAKVLHKAPRRPSRIAEMVPAELDDICLKCLAKVPSARYAGVGALLLDLQRFLENLESSDITVLAPDRRSTTNTPSAYQLRIDSGPHGLGRFLRLPRQRIVIGRSRDCDLVLKDEHKMVSRSHCGVIWNEETSRHVLIDYGAHYGVKVNDRQVRDHAPLTAGDRIGIAEYVLVFEACSKGQREQPPPAAATRSRTRPSKPGQE